MTNFPLLSELAYWISERSLIQERRAAGVKKPWTQDPILQSYRFCNVHREHDKVTQWIDRNWRRPFAGHENMAFAMLLARLVNWPDTLAILGFPQEPQWDGATFVARMHDRQMADEKTFGGAYIVSTNGVQMDKAEYLDKYVLTPVFRLIRQLPNESLEDAYKFLINMNGVGSFIAGQIIADLKYTSVLGDAIDWHDWCAKGPGSMRGLNRLAGHPLEMKWNNEQFVRILKQVREQLGFARHDICLQDLQNCLCEFDKYQRVKLGQGKPRASYAGI